MSEPEWFAEGSGDPIPKCIGYPKIIKHPWNTHLQQRDQTYSEEDVAGMREKPSEGITSEQREGNWIMDAVDESDSTRSPGRPQ